MAPAIRGGETSLVERARQGDNEAFATLVDARLAATFRTTLAILGNEADARDATQEIFLRAWRDLPDLREPDRFAASFDKSWSTPVGPRSVGAAAGSSARSRSVPYPAPARSWRPGRARTTIGRPTSTCWSERSTACQWPSDAPGAHHFEHLPLSEIAERLGVPSNTVKSRLFSARRSLERALEVERR